MTSVVQSKYLREILQILDFGVDIKEIECASEGKPSFLPVFRSGSCAEMGPKQYMEDEHIRIDNLAAYLGESASFSSPGAFYGYTTRYRKLVIANAGDCGAVLGKRGRAIELSKDHKPDSKSERHRIEKLGEPELQETILTDDDEFLIMGCDGLWDVMSSQCAVTMARKELMMHNDPERCSRELVREALKRNTCDNLTVIVVCFSPDPPPQIEMMPQTRVRQSASMERSNLLKGVLESNS
nr:probable protein phosphatase 2C 27 isoform X2 [Ipomoea trifida]